MFSNFQKALFFYIHSIFVLPNRWVDPVEQLINCMIRNTFQTSSLVFFLNLFSFIINSKAYKGLFIYSRIYGIIRDKQRYGYKKRT